MGFQGYVTEVQQDPKNPHHWGVHIVYPGKDLANGRTIPPNDRWFGYDSEKYRFHRYPPFDHSTLVESAGVAEPPNPRKPALWKKLFYFTLQVDPTFYHHLPPSVQEALKSKGFDPFPRVVPPSVWEYLLEAD